MALREIRREGDPCLRKVCRPVEKIDEKLQILIDDMFDTMYESNGVGLAAPQVGVIRRLFVIDIGENPWVFINPTIKETKGELEDTEGCLSSPGEFGKVIRPAEVTVTALDRYGEEFTLHTDEPLFARAICHENDHLDGKLFKDIVTRMMTEDEL